MVGLSVKEPAELSRTPPGLPTIPSQGPASQFAIRV